MKQSIILERAEIEMLKRGESLILNIVGGKPIEIMFDQSKRHGNRYTSDADGPKVSEEARILEFLDKNGPTPQPLLMAMTKINKNRIALYRLLKKGRIVKGANKILALANNTNGR